MKAKIKSTDRHIVFVYMALPALFLVITAFAASKTDTSDNRSSITSGALIISQNPMDFLFIDGKEKAQKPDEVDEMPEFPEGQKALQSFIVSNIKYPEDARKAGISGKVFVKFTVTKNGKITGAKIERGVNPSLDSEALRVINLMPDWKPGKKDGVPVPVEMVLPIQFSLNDKK